MEYMKYFDDGIQVLKKQLVVFVLCGVLVVIVSGTSFGIFSGPFLGAYLMMAISFLREGKEPKFTDIFACLPRLLDLLPFVLVPLLIAGGLYLYILPGVLVLLCWIYVLPLMVDKQLSVFEAMKTSYAKVKEKGIFLHFSFFFLLFIVPELFVNIIAAVLPPAIIIRLLLVPFHCGCLASLYLEQFADVPTPPQLPDGKGDLPNKRSPVAGQVDDESENNEGTNGVNKEIESNDSEETKNEPMPGDDAG